MLCYAYILVYPLVVSVTSQMMQYLGPYSEIYWVECYFF
jgi:hypothetical protein